MKWKEILLFLVPGVLEIAGIIALSLALGSVPFRWGRIFLAGLALTIIVYVIRHLPGVPPFTHMIVEILILVLVIAKVIKVPLSKGFIIVFASVAFLAILEYVVAEVFILVSGMDNETFSSNDMLWFFAGLLQAIIMISAAFIASRHIKPDPDAWKLRAIFPSAVTAQIT